MATSAANPLASGDTAYLYRATIGPRGQDYYLRHFARFDADGRASTSWNWAAYWGTINWLAYRRMWGWALAYVAALLGLTLLIFGVGKLVLDYSTTSAVLLFLLLLTVAFVVPGLYANAWYYTHCNEKITAALRNTREIKDAATVLASQAPDNRRLLTLAVVNGALLALALGVLNWISGTESGLPQLAANEGRPLAATQSGPLLPLPVAPPTRVASAPAVVASSPVPVAVASDPAASAPEAPRLAQAASAPVAPPVPPAAAGSKPVLLNAADRAPAPVKPEPAVLPARPPRVTASASQSATATPGEAARSESPTVAARAARPASAPQQRYVWVIQVGAYAQEANAQGALAQVQALGLEAGAESFEADKGTLTRVRVGPFTRQAEANQAALRIKTLNLPVLVIRQQP